MSAALDMSIPERSIQQRRDALATANRIRTFRADLKRDLKAGRVNVVQLLNDPPEEIEMMKIFELLLAMPKFGRVKVNKILNRCRMSPSKRVGGISERQRNELIIFLTR